MTTTMTTRKMMCRRCDERSQQGQAGRERGQNAEAGQAGDDAPDEPTAGDRFTWAVHCIKCKERKTQGSCTKAVPVPSGIFTPTQFSQFITRRPAIVVNEEGRHPTGYRRLSSPADRLGRSQS